MVTRPRKDEPFGVVTCLLRSKAALSLRAWLRMACLVLAAMGALATLPGQSVSASDIRMDRVWALDLQGIAQSLNASRLTIEVDNVIHLLSYDFEVIRDGRAVDAKEVQPGTPVALEKQGGSVKRIFLIEEGFQ